MNTTLLSIIAQAGTGGTAVVITDLIQNILFWIALGAIMGFLARAILPGEQKMGLISTALIGAVGSFLGGVVAWKLLKIDVSNLFSIGSILSALVGSVVVLIVWCLISKKSWR